MSILAKSTLQTLAFFDAQTRPLTLIEINNYLVKNQASLDEIDKVLNSELKGFVESSKGFYYLSKRAEAVKQRHARYQVSLQRTYQAQRAVRWMRCIPFVRAVAISGSQALLNSSQKSDIDILILVAPGRIWTARMLVSFYFQVLGRRRHGKYTRNRFCLNHYLSTDTQITRDKNLYTAAEYASLIPLFGQRYWDEFWQKNLWIKDYFPNAVFTKVSSERKDVRLRGQIFMEFMLKYSGLAFVFNWLARLYQKSRIVEQDFVFISDSELSFHPESKGQRVLAKYKERRRVFGLDKAVKKA